jgi:hypothetical protein
VVTSIRGCLGVFMKPGVGEVFYCPLVMFLRSFHTQYVVARGYDVIIFVRSRTLLAQLHMGMVAG